MTCIVSFIDKKKRTMWMASDSQSTDGWTSTNLRGSKIIDLDHYLIGGCGFVRYGQIIAHGNNLPAPKGDLMAFMCSEFVAHIAKICSDSGFLRKKEIPGGGNLLVLVNGRAFSVDSMFGVIESNKLYDVVGSGSQVATGSLYCDNKRGFLEKNPKNSLSCAILAAKSCIWGVGGRIVIKI